MTRSRLPERRPSIWFGAEWQGHEFAVTVGIDPALGLPLEVFANAKRGAMHSTIADAAVVISIALQHGATIAELRRLLLLEMTFDGTEIPASPIGAILKAIEEGLARLAKGESV